MVINLLRGVFEQERCLKGGKIFKNRKRQGKNRIFIWRDRIAAECARLATAYGGVPPEAEKALLCIMFISSKVKQRENIILA